MERTLRDAIYGMAVADALGVPGEFRSRGTYRIEGMVSGGAHRQPAGTFSDDTSMALASCDSIRELGHVDCEDMREKFVAWWREGAYAVNGITFDIGNTVAAALAEGCGRDGDWSNGNGSLMRIIPLAFVDGITDEEIDAVSAITHAHEVSTHACVLYVRLAQELLAGVSVADALAKLDEGHPYGRLRDIADVSLDEIRSTGYVVHTLEAALWALATTDNYADCVLVCVNMGDDTDTVAAVAGGLAGIVYGLEGIPAEWIEALRGKEIIEACLF